MKKFNDETIAVLSHQSEATDTKVTKSWKRKSINKERTQEENGQAETLLAVFK